MEDKKTLTEQFGPCGVGWKYEITRQWTEAGAAGVISAFCNIDLRIKYDGEWSDAIPGTGGSAFVAAERNGPYTSDECYKMALTDAISVACKALGMGADVYWSNDRTKYDNAPQSPAAHNTDNLNTISGEALRNLYKLAAQKGRTQEMVVERIYKQYKCKPMNMNQEQYNMTYNGYSGLPDVPSKGES